MVGLLSPTRKLDFVGAATLFKLRMKELARAGETCFFFEGDVCLPKDMVVCHSAFRAFTICPTCTVCPETVNPDGRGESVKSPRERRPH